MKQCTWPAHYPLAATKLSCINLQVQQLQHSLHGCEMQISILTEELQHKCQQLDTLSESHKALLSRFQELTVLMSEAHNKLNTAVAKSSKAIAAGHTKVRVCSCRS